MHRRPYSLSGCHAFVDIGQEIFIVFKVGGADICLGYAVTF